VRPAAPAGRRAAHLIILYPRPYRPAKLEVYWRGRPPPWPSGCELLPVAPLRWWQGRLHVSRRLLGLNIPFGFGSLSVFWRR
jgi:hypothetical protein